MHHNLTKYRYIVFNKPYRVMSQFSSVEGKKTLGDFFNIKKNIYPVGRLDYDSEGLLILTNDGAFSNRLINPAFGHKKIYLVQVENIPQKKSLDILRNGIRLGEKVTRKAEADLVNEPEWLWERVPPVRFRKTVPDCWLEIKIEEGMNRQIRRMTAAIGHPALRLIRTGIEFLSIRGLAPGNYRDLSETEIIEFYKLLKR